MNSLANIIIRGDLAQVESFLALSPDLDLNAHDEYGFTPLIEAAIMGKTDILKALVSRGVDVNGQDLTGGTALHWAVENSNLPMAEYLLKHHADPNAYTFASQPVLINPIMRDQAELKMLLYQYGASLPFAQDFINTKLIGHRFQLAGRVDIVNASNKFISLKLEGFILEFSAKTLCNELLRYLNNFAARTHRSLFKALSRVAHAMHDCAELAKYQQYQIDICNAQFKKRIHELLDSDLLILPVNYEGHAISIVVYQNRLAICDRRMDSPFADSILIYKIGKQGALTKRLIKKLIYDKKPAHFIEKDLPRLLELTPETHIPIQRQISGNCSWANIEAAVPAALTLLLETETPPKVIHNKHPALAFFTTWREWDKDQALNACIESFYTANQARQISKASLLACVLFQRCNVRIPRELTRIHKIIPLLKRPGLEHILKHYLSVYHNITHTDPGKNLLAMIEDYEDTA